MAYNALNNLIDAYIYANGVQAITGQILNGVLKQMVSQLGSGYHLMGVAGPETVPASNDYAMAYFAATAGEYTDFGGITIAAGEVAVLLTSGNGSWSKQTIYNVPTTTEDLENTANFITNAVTDLVNYYTKTEVDDTLANYPTLEALATALADYYTKQEIDGQKAETDAALADRYTKSETDTKLEDYYKKVETYDKDEVDSIVAALSRQEYIVAWDGLAAPDVSAIPAGVTVTYSGTTYTGTFAASASTVNKIYMVWNGTAYDMYGTSADGGYSWVPMGTTTVDLSQYATKSEVSQLEAKVDEKADQDFVERIVFGDFTKDIIWSDGYVNAYGTIRNLAGLKFTQPFLLRKGQQVTVGTNETSLGIIGKTTADSLQVGDTITVIQVTPNTSGFQKYTYTADEDTKIVLSVVWEDHIVSLYDTNSIDYKLDSEIANIREYIDGEKDVTLNLFQSAIYYRQVGGLDIKSGTPYSVEFIGDSTKVTKITGLYIIDADNTEKSIYNLNLNQKYNFYGETKDIIDAYVYIVGTNIIADEDLVVVFKWQTDTQKQFATLFGNDGLINKALNTSGVSTDSNGWGVTPFIPYVLGEDVDWTHNSPSDSDVVYFAAYDGDKNIIIGGIWRSFSAKTRVIYADFLGGLPSVPKYIRGTYLLNSGASLKIGGVTVWEESEHYSFYNNGVKVNIDNLRENINAGELPNYYYAENYLLNKADRINRCGGLGADDTFVFITDEHWEYNTRRSPIILRELAKKTNINRLLSSGDHTQYVCATDERLLTSIPSINPLAFKFMDDFRRNVGLPLISSMGNHEYLTFIFEQGLFDNVDFDGWLKYAYLIQEEQIIPSKLPKYFYYDNATAKIRYVFLATFKQGEETGSGGNCRITAEQYTEQSQLEWLENEALSVEEGWGIVVVAHWLAGVYYSNQHTNDQRISSSAYQKEIFKVLLSYNGNGKIICCLTGHLHRDGVVLIDDTLAENSGGNLTGRAIFLIGTTCDANSFTIPDEMLEDRETGTIKESAFDVCLVNKEQSLFSAIRIGAPANNVFNYSGSLEERHFDYESKTVSVGNTITLSYNLNGTILWESGDENVAIVADGVVTGIAPGIVVITATSSDNTTEMFIVKVN